MKRQVQNRVHVHRQRVTYQDRVTGLALHAFWYAFLVATAGTGLWGVWVGFYSIGHLILLAFLAGAFAGGLAGLIVLLVKDRAWALGQVQVPHVELQQPDPVAPAVADQPLTRQYAPGQWRYGRHKLTADQLLALAKYVVVDGGRSLSGRKLQAAGVIQDRLQDARPLQEDMIGLGYAVTDGHTTVATAALVDYLKKFTPPPQNG